MGINKQFIILLSLIVICFGYREPVPIEVNGNLFFSNSYLSDFLNRKQSRNIVTAIQKILRLYNNAGYPFCRIIPEIVQEDSSLTRIILNINEGDRVTINDYVYVSTGRTLPGALKRFAGGKTDILFSLRTVDYMRQKFRETGIFESITDNIVRQDDRHYLRFDLVERQSDFISLLG